MYIRIIAIENGYSTQFAYFTDKTNKQPTPTIAKACKNTSIIRSNDIFFTLWCLFAGISPLVCASSCSSGEFSLREITKAKDAIALIVFIIFEIAFKPVCNKISLPSTSFELALREHDSNSVVNR